MPRFLILLLNILAIFCTVAIYMKKSYMHEGITKIYSGFTILCYLIISIANLAGFFYYSDKAKIQESNTFTVSLLISAIFIFATFINSLIVDLQIGLSNCSHSRFLGSSAESSFTDFDRQRETGGFATFSSGIPESYCDAFFLDAAVIYACTFFLLGNIVLTAYETSKIKGFYYNKRVDEFGSEEEEFDGYDF